MKSRTRVLWLTLRINLSRQLYLVAEELLVYVHYVYVYIGIYMTGFAKTDTKALETRWPSLLLQAVF